MDEEKAPVIIEYCTSWGYVAKAASLAERILKTHHDKVAYVMLVPSSGGVHEVRFGDQLLHSKAETKRHPDPRDVLEKIKHAPVES